MHITYNFERRLTDVALPSAEGAPTPTAIMVLIDQRIADLRKEEKQIRDICVQLAGFLKENSILPFNDDLVEYFRHFLEEEKQKRATNRGDSDLIRGLEAAIEAYQRDLELFSKSIGTLASKEEFVPPSKIEEVFDLVAQLYKLPINGNFIREQMTKMKRAQMEEVQNNETQIDLLITADSPQVLADLKNLLDERN